MATPDYVLDIQLNDKAIYLLRLDSETSNLVATKESEEPFENQLVSK